MGADMAQKKTEEIERSVVLSIRVNYALADEERLDEEAPVGSPQDIAKMLNDIIALGVEHLYEDIKVPNGFAGCSIEEAKVTDEGEYDG
jgi:hypothetical protein